MARPRRRRALGESLTLEKLESRQLLTANPMGANIEIEAAEFDSVDIDDDGTIGPLDAIPMINEMSRGVNNPDAGSAQRASRFDVNDDGSFSALDVLMVINRFGARRGDRSGPGGNQGDRPGNGPGPHSNGRPPLPIRTIDGTNNNMRHEEWGSADQPLARIAAPEYEDGLSTPTGSDRASAREISNLVAAQSESVVNDRGLSDFVWQWGQFLDHDIDLTENADPAEAFDIEVPTGDAYFDPFGTGTELIELNRSVYEVDENGVRQQVNQITAFIDGSNVYGSDETRAAALRTFAGGQLKTSDGDLLPFNVDGLSNAGGTSETLFLAGDVRANEQAGLTAMHTLWVREHNRIAEDLASRDPQATDEQLYQRARTIVIAEMQAITYNEFIPALLGQDALERYDGYDRRVDPTIANEFSTAAYRFGHSMLSSQLLRLNNDGTTAAEGNLALRDAFFNPATIIDNGIDSLLVGLANQEAQEIDSMLVDDVRNFLFGPPGAGGFDLASLNIQRGRDHGLADYNQMRVDYGLDPVQSFDQISSDPGVQAALTAAYDDVDSIDAWVGGLAEDHVPGASVGELVQAVLVDQFTRLRDGDRFWYQQLLRGPELRMIENTSLADVIERNTEIAGLQSNVFFVPSPVRVSVDAPSFSPSPDLNHPSGGTRNAPGFGRAMADTGRDRAGSRTSHDRTDHRGELTDLVFADDVEFV